MGLPTQQEIEDTYIADYDKKYQATYVVLDLLQKVFYSSNAAREAFVEMCDSDYVQKVTFDSYLYKTVQEEILSMTSSCSLARWDLFSAHRLRHQKTASSPTQSSL